MKKWILLGSLLLIVGIGGVWWMLEKKVEVHRDADHAIERFVREHLMDEDGLVHTNLTDRKEEVLSESIGLWMKYLVLTDDQATYDSVLQQVEKKWMDRSGLVKWRQVHGKFDQASATIDDLRIVSALADAAERWGNSHYDEVAKRILKANVQAVYQSPYFIDFYDLAMKKPGQTVTLSYTNEHELKRFVQKGWLEEHVLAEWLHATKEWQLIEDEFVVRYELEQQQLVKEKEVNAIDLAYYFYHRLHWTEADDKVFAQLREQFSRDGHLAGTFENRTFKPVAAYESVAVYSLFAMTAIEREDQDFAKRLVKRAEDLSITSDEGRSFGYLSESGQLEVHSFDHLLYLIARQLLE